MKIGIVTLVVWLLTIPVATAADAAKPTRLNTRFYTSGTPSRSISLTLGMTPMKESTRTFEMYFGPQLNRI